MQAIPCRQKHLGQTKKYMRDDPEMRYSHVTVQVDRERNLVYVRGQVPGHKGNFVLIRDAHKKTHEEQPERPFPTSFEAFAESIAYAPKPLHNPFERRER